MTHRRGGIALLLLTLCAGTAGADSMKNVWDAGSNLVFPLVVGGELGLLFGSRNGEHEAWQGFKALAANGLETEALKYTVREKRPNRREFDSFPSLHASTAFTMATVIADYHPDWALPAYATAGLVSYSRERLGEHRWQDIFVGGALGYLNGRLFAKNHVMLSEHGVAVSFQF